jgi:hypothetical protein
MNDSVLTMAMILAVAAADQNFTYLPWYPSSEGHS